MRVTGHESEGKGELWVWKGAGDPASMKGIIGKENQQNLILPENPTVKPITVCAN